MTDLICIRKLMKQRGLPNHCLGRRETAVCIECRAEREHGALLGYYRRDMELEVAHCEPCPEKARAFKYTKDFDK